MKRAADTADQRRTGKAVLPDQRGASLPTCTTAVVPSGLVVVCAANSREDGNGVRVQLAPCEASTKTCHEQAAALTVVATGTSPGKAKVMLPRIHTNSYEWAAGPGRGG